MKIKNLPVKYKKIWEKCQPLLKKGRADDLLHAAQVVEKILAYKGKIKIDREVLIPVAMMHDIGHSAILKRHLKYVTGEFKIVNGKLVHMLAGAKIAEDILTAVKYDNRKIKEIADIISMHDADQLSGIDKKRIYDTVNRKFFHDIDSLDRYNEKRIKKFSIYFKNKEKIFEFLEKGIENFFYQEFKEKARESFENIKYED